MSGSYIVTVDQNATVQSLVIGSGSSNIQLLIRSGVYFNITGQVKCICPRVTIFGHMNVGSLAWSGQYLTGSSSTGSGELVVSRLFLIERGSYDHKYLEDIIVNNQMNFTIDASLSSSAYNLQCQYCQIVNEKNATFLSNGIQMSLSHRSSISTTGFGSGLVNKGTAIIRYSQSTYWYWDIHNLGIVKVIDSYRHNSYFRFYGWMTNDGLFQVYGGRMYVYSPAQLYPSNGSYELYGYPFRYSRAPSPVGLSNEWQWKEYLRDIYQNSSAGIWDTRSTCYLTIGSYYSQYLHFNRITGFGQVQMSVQSTRASTIYFSNGLYLGRLGQLFLYSYSSTVSQMEDNTIVVDKSGFTVSLASIQRGWNLKISSDTFMQTYRRLMIKEDAMVDIHPGTSSIQLIGIVGVETSGTLTVHGRDCTIEGDLYLSGTFNISSSTVRVSEKFVFTQGYIGGESSSLYVNKIGNFTGDSQKTIDGTSLYVERPIQSTDNGVIAEYFQYRVITDVTNKIQNLFYFPEQSSGIYTLPLEFDLPQSEPNKVEFLSTFDRLPQYYGNSPLAITSTYDWFDTQSAESFTYGYACRLWAFLQIDHPGLYVFYVDTGYGLHIRLWINDQVVFLSNSYTYFLSKQSTDPQSLQTGLIRIRVDFIQEASYWTSRNALVLTYSGPGFSEKSLPITSLFVRSLSTGTVEYANPSFDVNDTTKLFTLQSTLELSGIGLIFAKNGAKLVITETGVLDVVDDITWVSHSLLSTKSMIINSGKIVRSGIGGVATFFAGYRDAGGSLIDKNGMIEFKDATKDGGLALWNNPGGGSWLDPNNWIPSRVPGLHDIVHITVDGDYVVVIPDGIKVSITSLTLGFQSSNPQLFIGRFSQLFISDRLDIYSDNITIDGKVTAEHVAWRGEMIRGGGFPGEIIATNMDVIKGVYGAKYLSNVTITTLKSLTIDSSLNNQNYDLYCVDCMIINSNSSIALANAATWRMQSLTTSNWNVFQTGLVNYGLVVFELDRCCSINNYWDVYNYGELKVVTKNYGHIYSMNVYGVWLNYNVTNVYATNLYLRTVRSPLITIGGVWNVYGYPVRYEYAPDPVGDMSAGTWREYLSDVYQNASDLRQTLWNPGRTIACFVMLSGYTVYDFGKLNSYGPVEFHFTHSPSQIIRFIGGVSMGRHGKLYFQKPSVSFAATSSAHAFIGQNSELTAGDISISRGWNVTFGEWSNVTFYRSATLYENSALIAMSMSTLSFHDQLTTLKNSLLDFSGTNLICRSSLSTYGLVELGSGSLTVYGRWEMFSGAVTGSGATIFAYGGWTVSGDSDKILKGINVFLAPSPSPSSTKNGIIVDYFQYRVDTEHTRKDSGFLYPSSLPAQVHAVPNIQRIEHSLHRYPILYGNSPLYYSTYGTPSLDNPGSFTYQYGGRLWMYLKTDMSGDYTFYFLTGYSFAYRLWIDESELYNSGYYNTFLNLETAGPFRLQRGYRKLRIDFVQRSSWWQTTGNTLIVYYSGPDFAKKLIPPDKIYYHNGFSYAKRTYVLPTSTMASISGGPIVAQQSVNVTICSTCALQILDDFTWYSDRDPMRVTHFINFGLVIRKGEPGTATIFGKYVAMPRSRRKSTDGGLLEFGDGDPLGNLVTWNNPAGGSWMDPRNWIPQRTPRPEDIVHITHPGEYRVIIPTHSVVNITALSIGSYKSSGDLVIESGSTLDVRELIEIHSRHFTIKGLLLAKKMSWYGQYLSGTSSYQGKIVVTSSLTVSQSNAMYLQYVRIENRGNMTIGCRQQSIVYYCTDCVIYNYGTLLVNCVNSLTYESGARQEQNEYPTGIINYGVVTFELRTNPTYTSYLYLYWYFQNYGNTSVINKDYKYSCNLYIYGVLTNHGNFRIYMTHAYIQSSAQLPTASGSWKMYGRPYRDNNLPDPPGYKQHGSWQSYLDNIYGNQSDGMWDTSRSFSFYLLSAHGKHMFFNSLQFYGPYDLTVSSSNWVVLYFQALLNLGQHSVLSLGTTTSTNYIICGSHSNIVLNRALIGSGWSIDGTGNTTFFALGRFVMLGRSTVNMSKAVSLHFEESLYTSLGSKLVLVDSHMTVSGQWNHLGDAILQSSTVVVEGSLDWQLGSFTGTLGGSLRVQRLCKVSSTLGKRLSGVNMVIAASERYEERHGVVAEYFQYRVATSLTSPIPNLYYFPDHSSSSNKLPMSFDYANSTANVIRLEPRLSRLAHLGGNAPLVYKPQSLVYDTTSIFTFSYSYAARLWTYLKIEHSGTYVFYFRSSYSVYFRLWVNDYLQFISYSYNDYQKEEQSPPILLNTGLQKLRLDYIQRSSYWNSQGGTIIVLYKGPRTPKQIIPNDKLYSVFLSGNQPTSAAQNWKFLPNFRVCTSNLSLSTILLNYQPSISHCVVEGEGFVAQDGASITVGESGILDFKADGDWPVTASNDTRLTIRGMVTKTAGTGHTVLTADYDEISACVKPLSGNLDIGFQNYSLPTSKAVSPVTGIEVLTYKLVMTIFVCLCPSLFR